MRLWDFVLRLMPVRLGSPEWLETLCGPGTLCGAGTPARDRLRHQKTRASK